MRDYTQQLYDALVSAPDDGLTVRDLVTIYARGLTDAGQTQTFCFWNDMDTVTIAVTNPDTGVDENRDYTGDGSLLTLDDIPLTADLDVRSVDATFSPLHDTVADMVRGWDIRGARAEVHALLLDPRTNLPVSAALPRFVGAVDGAPISTAAVGSESSVKITLVSATDRLTRTSPLKKSDTWLQTRSGDRFRRYTDTANVQIWWGEKRQKVDGSTS